MRPRRSVRSARSRRRPSPAVPVCRRLAPRATPAPHARRWCGPSRSRVSSRPHKVAPQSFDDAQLIADRYKNSQAVIVNLQGVDQNLSRRIIDFASGLCYGIGGQMERVANHVYLLTPADVEVPDEMRGGDLDGGGA